MMPDLMLPSWIWWIHEIPLGWFAQTQYSWPTNREVNLFQLVI